MDIAVFYKLAGFSFVSKNVNILCLDVKEEKSKMGAHWLKTGTGTRASPRATSERGIQDDSKRGKPLFQKEYVGVESNKPPTDNTV